MLHSLFLLEMHASFHLNFRATLLTNLKSICALCQQEWCHLYLFLSVTTHGYLFIGNKNMWGHPKSSSSRSAKFPWEKADLQIWIIETDGDGSQSLYCMGWCSNGPTNATLAISKSRLRWQVATAVFKSWYDECVCRCAFPLLLVRYN